MIFDFGCRTADATITQVLPALRGVFASLIIFAGLAALGRAVRKDAEFLAVDIMCGWGLVAAFMTLLSVFSVQPLVIAMYFVFSAMLLFAIPAIRHKYFNAPFWLFIIFPGLVILLAINIAGIGKWDDFSHWVPNAIYVYLHDGVPSKNLPAPHSVWPGYPYALPFLTYLSSHLAGGFLVAGGTMINFLSLMVFAAMLAAIGHSSRQTQITLSNMGWLGFALLAVTLLNPNFNASFTMTSQGDTPTMVVVGTLGLLLWNLVEALQRREAFVKRDLFLQILFVSILLVLIKQVNIALLGLLFIAFGIVSWKNNVLKQALLLMIPILAVSFSFRLIWQHHVDTEISGNGFVMHPFSAWRWDLLPSLLQAMGRETLRKSGCFGLILLAGLYGFRSLFRAPSRERNFAILSGFVGCGYVLFLLVCYLGASFSELEIRRAASFYRYSTQVGLLQISLMWVMAPRLLGRLTIWKPALFSNGKIKRIACLFCIIVLPLSLLMNSEWLVAKPSAKMCDFRDQARYIARSLPENAHLAIFEPETDGMFSFVVNFELALDESLLRQNPSLVWSVDQFNSDQLLSRVKDVKDMKDVDAVYAVKAQQAPIDIAGFSNKDDPFLILRDGAIWKLASP